MLHTTYRKRIDDSIGNLENVIQSRKEALEEARKTSSNFHPQLSPFWGDLLSNVINKIPYPSFEMSSIVKQGCAITSDALRKFKKDLSENPTVFFIKGIMGFITIRIILKSFQKKKIIPKKG